MKMPEGEMGLATVRRTTNEQLSNLVGLSLQDFLDQADKIDSIREDIQGIWCGKEGKTSDIITAGPFANNHRLVVGWAYGRVEYAYVS